MRQNILQVNYNFGHKLWKKVSEPARDLIMRLLVRDPELRLDADAALKHQWLEVGMCGASPMFVLVL